MLDKNLFKETRPVRPDIINVVIDITAVQRNVFKIRGKRSYPNFSLILTLRLLFFVSVWVAFVFSQQRLGRDH